MTPNDNLSFGYFTLEIYSKTAYYYNIPNYPYPLIQSVTFCSSYAGTWIKEDDNKYLLLTDGATYQYKGNNDIIKKLENELIKTYGKSKGERLANDLEIMEIYYIDKLYQYIEINDSSDKFVFVN